MTAVSNEKKKREKIPQSKYHNLIKRKTYADKLLPEKNVRLWHGRMRRQKRNDGMRVGGRDGGEERSSMEGSRVEKVGRFYGLAKINRLTAIR